LVKWYSSNYWYKYIDYYFEFWISSWDTYKLYWNWFNLMKSNHKFSSSFYFSKFNMGALHIYIYMFYFNLFLWEFLAHICNCCTSWFLVHHKVCKIKTCCKIGILINARCHK
jgi:hypothetical protein